MRIFPEGARDWLEPSGKAIVILAACMLAIAASAFVFKTWILYSWSRTNGTVVNSHVATTASDDGTTMCSAVESVQFVVDGQQKVVDSGGHTFTDNCKEIEARVATVRGQKRTVIYNRRAPGATYVNPGFNLEFYLVAFVLTCMAGAFAFAGWVAIKVGRWMVRRNINLP